LNTDNFKIDKEKEIDELKRQIQIILDENTNLKQKLDNLTSHNKEDTQLKQKLDNFTLSHNNLNDNQMNVYLIHNFSEKEQEISLIDKQIKEFNKSVCYSDEDNKYNISFRHYYKLTPQIYKQLLIYKRQIVIIFQHSANYPGTPYPTLYIRSTTNDEDEHSFGDLHIKETLSFIFACNYGVIPPEYNLWSPNIIPNLMYLYEEMVKKNKLWMHMTKPGVNLDVNEVDVFFKIISRKIFLEEYEKHINGKMEYYDPDGKKQLTRFIRYEIEK
jgi:hypothetical protein